MADKEIHDRNNIEFSSKLQSYFFENAYKHTFDDIKNYAELADYRDLVQCTWSLFKEEFTKQMEMLLLEDEFKEVSPNMKFSINADIRWI